MKHPDSAPWQRRAPFAALVAAALAAGCGGGQSDSTSNASNSATALAAADGRVTALSALSAQERTPRDLPTSDLDARRFLTQATFGPDENDVVLLQRIGYGAWIDRQFALPPSTFRQRWEGIDAALRAAGGSGASATEAVDVFWERALTADDQLRVRVAYALSQIFVVSYADNEVEQRPRALAAWMDMLATDGLGTYRQLIESVARHPVMGRYLNHLGNQKEDGSGRVPDENFAREVMQLFSIGVARLNPDGSEVLVNGQPVETYTAADVTNMARVFTGWGLACPDYPSAVCFSNGASATNAQDPDRDFKPMVPYMAFHSPEPKMLFGTTLIPFGRSNPTIELKAALDLLDTHPNTGPFVGKQLIQRLVTSNPSKAYVASISAVWANNGAGVRGDINAVVKAILTHPEARQTTRVVGKLREPVLRLSAFLRAFPHASDTGRWRVGETSDTATSLGQTPLRAPSVFNFYRPGYVLPNSSAAASGLVAPEGQLLNETSVSGWANFVADSVVNGVGGFNSTINGMPYNRRDLQRSWREEIALANDARALTDQVIGKLLYGQRVKALREEVSLAVESIAVPKLSDDGSNAAEVDAALRNRVYTALMLTMASTDFLIQK